MKDKEIEQQMLRELAEFAFEFGEKYDVLLDVRVKQRKIKINVGNGGRV